MPVPLCIDMVLRQLSARGPIVFLFKIKDLTHQFIWAHRHDTLCLIKQTSDFIEILQVVNGNK